MQKTVRFRLNGEQKELAVDPDRVLLWVLRTDLGLTGTKYGCGESLCGACTVLVDKKAVRSCQLPMRDVEGTEVVTIEGLAANGELHPLQRAFAENDALQCGFCTSGMIMSAYELLLGNPNASSEEIVAHMDDHLCRCGSHTRVIEAIRAASQSMKGARP
jgi:aerobic-type carbon monoxide dehydrogenase small subunit (CoxS/CutS family)